MTEAIVPLIALAVVVATSVWYASGLLKALHTVTSMLVDSHRLIDQVHYREIEGRRQLENRLMARDFDHYKTYELAEGSPDAPEVPDMPTDAELRRERPWIPGPDKPADTPPEILEELEALEK